MALQQPFKLLVDQTPAALLYGGRSKLQCLVSHSSFYGLSFQRQPILIWGEINLYFIVLTSFIINLELTRDSM